MMKHHEVVAAFDFDHTLINRDSLLPFLFYAEGYLQTGYRLGALCPVFVSFLVGKSSRQEVKEQILTRFFKGRAMEDLQAIGNRYADEKLDGYLKPEALERLRWHQAQGHRCVVVSASPEFYLKPWAARHGIEAVLASRLELTPTGELTGRLVGLNCWGAEKKNRLEAYLGPKEGYELYVYGDSRGDQELLALADHPYYRKY